MAVEGAKTGFYFRRRMGSSKLSVQIMTLRVCADVPQVTTRIQARKNRDMKIPRPFRSRFDQAHCRFDARWLISVDTGADQQCGVFFSTGR